MENKILKELNSLCRTELLDANDDIMEFCYTDVHYPDYIAFDGISLYNDFNLFSSKDYKWISEIEIHIENIDIPVSIVATDDNGKQVISNPSTRIRFNDRTQRLVFEINSLTKLVTLKLGDTDSHIIIYRIKIIGFDYTKTVSLVRNAEQLWKQIESKNISRNDFIDKEIIENQEKLEHIKSSIENLNTNYTDLNSAYELAQKQLDMTKTYLNNDRTELELTKKRIEESRSAAHKLESSISKLNNEFEDIETKVSDKNEEISQVQNRLKKFKQEEERYSEDFSAYKEEISNQQGVFIKLLIFVSVCMLSVVVFMYCSAIDMAENITPETDVWRVIASRAPIISINIIILGILSSILYFVINTINNNFSKISSLKQMTYLVKECVESQSVGVDVSNDELVKLRVQKKMELIREYLDKNISDNLK